jgi:hypothetical protein
MFQNFEILRIVIMQNKEELLLLYSFKRCKAEANKHMDIYETNNF